MCDKTWFCFQMTAANLAVCFLPSLFRLADYTQLVSQEVGQISEAYQPSYKSALSCLTSLIEHSESLRQVAYCCDYNNRCKEYVVTLYLSFYNSIIPVISGVCNTAEVSRRGSRSAASIVLASTFWCLGLALVPMLWLSDWPNRGLSISHHGVVILPLPCFT